MESIAVVLAVRRLAERRIVHRLRAADAVTPERACPLPGLHWLQGRWLRRLLAAGAVREASPGLYYLDESGLAGFRRWRRRRADGHRRGPAGRARRAAPRAQVVCPPATTGYRRETTRRRFLLYAVCYAAVGCALHRVLRVSWWLILSVAACNLWWEWFRPQIQAVIRPDLRPRGEGE